MKTSIFISLRTVAALALGTSLLATSSAALADGKLGGGAATAKAEANQALSRRVSETVSAHESNRYMQASVAKMNADVAREYRGAVKREGWSGRSNYIKAFTHRTTAEAHGRAATFYGHAATGKPNEPNKIPVPASQLADWSKRAEAHTKAAAFHNQRAAHYKAMDAKK